MRKENNRIEPTFDDDEHKGRNHEPAPPPFDLEPAQSQVPLSQMNLAIRVVSIVVVATCVFFVGDRLYSRYQERQLVNALEKELETWGSYVTEGLEQAGEASQRFNASLQAQREASERALQQRQEEQKRQRMATTEGRWLEKNCTDWTNAWNQLKSPTAEQKKQEHCARYQRYLQTGIAPPGTPRAGDRQR